MYILTADISTDLYELDVYILGIFDNEEEAHAAALSVEKDYACTQITEIKETGLMEPQDWVNVAWYAE